MTAGWLQKISNPSLGLGPWALGFVVIFGFAWGMLYGVIINVYFWPFAVGSVEQTWTPGIGLGETLARYAAFYAATSLGWDLMRAVGNVALILLLGAPTIRALTRFQRRFYFEIRVDWSNPIADA